MPGVLGEMYQILERIGVPLAYPFRDAQPKEMNPMRSHWSKAMKSLKKLDVFLRAWGGERGSACPTIPAKSKSAGSMKSLSTPVTNKPKTLENEFRFQVYHRDDKASWLDQPVLKGPTFYSSSLHNFRARFCDLTHSSLLRVSLSTPKGLDPHLTICEGAPTHKWAKLSVVNAYSNLMNKGTIYGRRP